MHKGESATGDSPLSRSIDAKTGDSSLSRSKKEQAESGSTRRSTSAGKDSGNTRSGDSQMSRTAKKESQETSSEDEESYSHLETANRDTAEARAASTWASDNFKQSTMTEGQRSWMKKLEKRDLSGVMPKLSQFLHLTGKEFTSNPRATPEYADQCLKEAELGPYFSEKRYPHIKSAADKALLAWAIQRGAGCIWLEGSERTYVRAFKHRLITRGPPVRVGMHRLSRPDMEWVEKAIAEDVGRGQLIKGSSEWGFPAFPTKIVADHRAIKRKRRVVVDYRALNRVTVRKVFLIPNSDQIKSCVCLLYTSPSPRDRG